MGWRVEGDNGGFVEWARGGWSADPRSEDDLRHALDAGQSALATATGPAYTPASPDDEFGVYLLARSLVPGARLTRGTPPAKDLPGAALPEGVVA